LARVLASPLFARAESQRRLLEYIVESTLAGDSGRLKEYTIAVGVMGRPPSFDPKIDPAIRVEVRRLRSRLASFYASSGAAAPLRIQIPKGGYRAEFVASESAADQGAAAKLRPPVRQAGLAVAILLLLATAALVTWRMAAGFRPKAVAPASIAVLPFANMTGNPQADFFSDGLTEELIGELARLPKLSVVARTSAFQFRSRPVDVRDIGRRLQVGFVLEGSVREASGGYRISAQLINAASGYHVWANTFDYPRGDLARLEQDIAHIVAASVQPAITNLPAPSSPGSADARAWEDYLRGRYLWNKRDQKSIVETIDFFRGALARDPSFAKAATGLADAHLILWSYNWVLPGEEAATLARKYADTALALDPASVEALSTRALLAGEYELDWPAAQRGFLRAIALEPAFARGHQWYATALAARGRFEEAFSQIELAQHLDPVAIPAYDTSASVSLYARRADLARAAIAKIEALDRGYHRLIVLRDSVNAIERQKLGLDWPLEFKRARARRGAELIRARKLRTEVVSPLDIAYCFDASGDREQALRWIETAIVEHDAGAFWLAVDWNLYSVRGDPRFRQILHRHDLDEALTRSTRAF
jgi:TolB-like protein